MVDFALPSEMPQLPPWILNTLWFVFGILVKSGFDYIRQDRNQQKQLERQRQENVREWNANVRRTIGSLQRQFESMDTNELDERNEMRDEIQKGITSLKEQKEMAPPDVPDETIKQIEAVVAVSDEDGFLDNEVPATTASVTRAHGYGPRSSPRRTTSSPNNESKSKSERKFIKQMTAFLQQMRQLTELCVDTDH